MGKSAELPLRSLGASGIITPVIGAGCWPIGGPDMNLNMPMGWQTGSNEDESILALERAWAGGIRLFDTADVYGHGRSERLIGRLVSQVDRSSLILGSKVGYFEGTASHGYEAGHMRRQLEQTLHNLGTDYLDVYAFHHPNFGEGDRYLASAVSAMQAFVAEGLVRKIGMRGPHRYSGEKATDQKRPSKADRFEALFHTIRPDLIAVRDNLLTPSDRNASAFRFAEEQEVGVLISKPLGQGLLTGKYSEPELVHAAFGSMDHRSRKLWFRPEALAELTAGLGDVKDLLGGGRSALVRAALCSCLSRSKNAVVLVGFTTAAQVSQNITSLIDDAWPNEDVLLQARSIMLRAQARAVAAAGMLDKE